MYGSSGRAKRELREKNVNFNLASSFVNASSHRDTARFFYRVFQRAGAIQCSNEGSAETDREFAGRRVRLRFTPSSGSGRESWIYIDTCNNELRVRRKSKRARGKKGKREREGTSRTVLSIYLLLRRDIRQQGWLLARASGRYVMAGSRYINF